MKIVPTIPWAGGTVRGAGCYGGIPIQTYHGQAICPGPSVSSTNLRRALEANGGSPQHMHHEWSGGADRKRDEEEARHLVLGRAAHHLLLGQESFREHFVDRP